MLEVCRLFGQSKPLSCINIYFYRPLGWKFITLYPRSPANLEVIQTKGKGKWFNILKRILQISSICGSVEQLNQVQ